jgi:hypothetical protein
LRNGKTKGFAVFRLITTSKITGSSTGRASARSPLITLAMENQNAAAPGATFALIVRPEMIRADKETPPPQFACI